jgi:hypothetical protein
VGVIEILGTGVHVGVGGIGV